MKRVLVLGVGSPFDDDRLGWQVIERLRQRDLPEGVLLKACDRPGAALLAEMQGMEAIIIIDALLADREAGEVVHLRLEDVLQQAGALSSHAFGVAEALVLGQAMNSLPSELCLLGVCIAAETRDAPSLPSLEPVLARVEQQLARYLQAG